MATAHPPLDMVASYAAGSASSGVALLVETHLRLCASCRTRIRGAEALGAAFLGAAPAAEMAPGARAATLARLDEAAPEPQEPRAGGGLPRALIDAAGAPIEGLRWRFRMPGVAEADLGLDGEERVSLLRVRPGVGVPGHTHTGIETTLVLQGALIDRGRTYGPGDVAVATAEDDHHPKAGPGTDCICLTVMSGGLRFTGAFGRALNLFAD